MLRQLLPRLSYVRALWREGLWAKWISAAYSLAGIFIFFRDDFWGPKDDKHWKLGEIASHFPLSMWIWGWLIILAIWIFEASFKLYRKNQAEILSLKWLDRSDIAKIGQGIIWENTFIINNDGFNVLNCRGPTELSALCGEEFYRIFTNCPKSSVARGYITISNRRQSAKASLYLRGGLEDAISRVDDLSNFSVIIDENYSFFLRIACESGYVWSGGASIQLWITSWSK